MKLSYIFLGLTVATLIELSVQWKGNVCSRTICSYRKIRVCRYRTWLGCCAWKWIWAPDYRTVYFCCPGWRTSSDQNCNEPICRPDCVDGTCIQPNVCRCNDGASGDDCNTLSCNYQRPCFPGTCEDGQNGADPRCTCDTGFYSPTNTNPDLCRKLQPNQAPEIYEVSARLSFYQSIQGYPAMEKYSIYVDSTMSNEVEELWTNRLMYNWLNVTASGHYMPPDNYTVPGFVKEYAIGIAGADVHILHNKISLSGIGEDTVLNVTRPCSPGVSSRNPMPDTYFCLINNQTIDTAFTSGDRLTITFEVTSGGYRALQQIKPNLVNKDVQEYLGQLNKKAMHYKFDFEKPTHHCLDQSVHCRTMFKMDEDVTKNALTLRWSEWTDEHSGMYRYAWEVFELKVDGNLVLREPEPLGPLKGPVEVNQSSSNTTSFSAIYRPPRPGVYSVILEASDKANNSLFIRRIALYDPESKVTIDADPERRLYPSSANPVGDFTWQQNPRADVVFTWVNHFVNLQHEEGKWLNKVLAYPPELEDFIKNIPEESDQDDHEGSRTINEIPNRRAIVKFEIQKERDSEEGKNQPAIPTGTWTDVGLNETFTINGADESLTSNDKVTFWVRATDAMGNVKVDRTLVRFDDTAPEHSTEATFMRNQQVHGVPYSSSVSIVVFDMQSGMKRVDVYVYMTGTDVLVNNFTMPIPSRPRANCNLGDLCYCTPTGCFEMQQVLAVSNCLLLVAKDLKSDQSVTLKLDFRNMAGLTVTQTIQIDNVSELNGTLTYFGPKELRATDIGETTATVTWTHSQSCYTRTEMWINYREDGQLKMTQLHHSATSYNLAGLKPGTEYVIELISQYGDVKSDPVPVFITTKDSCKSSNASIGEDCSSALCKDENSECVNNGGHQTCGCASKYIWTGTICILGPSGVTSKTDHEYNVDPAVPFDEAVNLDLLTPSTTWLTDVRVFPEGDLLATAQNSTSYLLSLRTTLTRLHTFLLVVTARSDQFRVQQILSLRLRPPPTVMNILLVDGTPRGSLLAQLAHSGGEGETYQLDSEDDTVDALFVVTDEGRVECGQDISLDEVTNEKTVAHEYNFNVSLVGSLIAQLNVLVFRDRFQSNVEENWNGVIVKYYLSPNDNFLLNPSNVPRFSAVSKERGSISLDNGVDFESLNDKIIRFEVKLETRDSSQTSSIDVELTILDKNDLPPKLVTNSMKSNGLYLFEVQGVSPGTVVGVVSSEDKDTVGTLSYSLEGDHHDSFTVDSRGVVRYTASSGKSVSGSQFDLRVIAYDGVQKSDAVQMKVFIKSINSLNKNLNMTFTSSVPEEEDQELFVADVSVSNYIKYNFTNFFAFDMFNVNASTGEVRTRRKLDREKDRTPTDFSVQAVRVSDDQCERVIIGQLQVTIIDVNDMPPKFAQTQYNATMAEETPSGVPILGLINIEAFDGDEGQNALLSFSLSGQDSKYFDVTSIGNSNRFTITTGSVPVDLENLTSNSLSFILIAVDNPEDASKRLSGSVTIVISVEDINDFTPTFSGNTISLNVTEGSPVEATLTATDGDRTNNDVSYKLSFGASGFFQINSTTGVLKTIKMLDRESINTFILTIHASDTGTPRKTGNTTVRVLVQDVNDNDPVFTSSYRRTVTEERCSSTPLLQVSASDADTGGNGQVRYSGNDTYFTVSEDGNILCKRPLNYEETKSHRIVVVATDMGSPKRSSNVTVEVVVIDINDNPPEFDASNYSTQLNSGEWFSNRPLLVIEVNDKDSGVFGEIKPLSLTSHADKFDISGSNYGVVRVNPNATKPTSDGTYTFNVKAVDGGGTEREVTVTIHVLIDVVPSTVQFKEYDFRFTMDEETDYSARVIGTVSLYNPGVDVEYSIIYDTDFLIDSKSGALTCREKLDRETETNRLFIVMAKESALSGGNSKDLTVVNITINDKNDNSPIFTRSAIYYMFDISEDAAIDQAVAVVKASDADDGANSKLEYSIESQSPSIGFQIDSTSGKISVSRGLDREKISQYSLVIKVSDMGLPTRLSATTTVNIGIMDVNDVTPHFDQDVYVINLPENQQVDSSVFTVTASDEDYVDNSTVTYQLQASSSCPLNVSNNGEIVLSSTLDYETSSGHLCVVYAIDMAAQCPSGCASQRTGSTTISLSVDDVNDNAPQFINSPYAANISQSAAIDNVVTDDVEAVDADSSNGNGLVKYFILSEENYFQIDIDSGEITVATSLNSIVGDNFRLTIEARDTPISGAQRTAQTTVDIFIIQDPLRPFFNKTYSVTVTEHSGSRDQLAIIQAYVTRSEGTVLCDVTNNCEYSIDGSTYYNSDAFVISPGTGELRLNNTELDRDVSGGYVLITVRVLDTITGEFTNTRVTVNINDINDNIPFFENLTATFIIRNSEEVHTIFATLTSTDKDQDSNPVYSLSELSDTDDLKIGVKGNGSLYVKESLLSWNGTITFDVNVRDSEPIEPSLDTASIRPQQQRIIVEVRGDDYNEHAPVFIQGKYEGTVYALARRGTPVAVENLRAVDADNHTVMYSIQEGNVRETFSINSSTAELSLHYGLDGSIPSRVNLHVIAVDIASPPKTGTCEVVISLTDVVPIQCIRQSEFNALSVDSKQRTIFLFLFIALAALLTVAVIYSIVTTYKWRKSVSRKSHYQKNIEKNTTKQGERTRYDGLEGQGLTAGYDGLNVRDFSAGVRNPGYVSADTFSTGSRCSPPDEPNLTAPSPTRIMFTTSLEHKTGL